jgi:hypothetical protein
MTIPTTALAIALLGPLGAAPRAPISGTYGYGTYGDTRGRSGAGCVLRVREIAGGARVAFTLECSLGPPSYNTGEAGGTVLFRRGVAVYRAPEGGEPCELRLAFTGAAVEVAQSGLCEFGRGVSATGVYRRLGRARPRAPGRR